MLYFLFYVFFVGFLKVSFSFKHVLIILLSLEFLVLSLYLVLYFFLSLNSAELFFSMLFLVFSVCEGALGLSLLVCLVRLHGSDRVKSLIVLW